MLSSIHIRVVLLVWCAIVPAIQALVTWDVPSSNFVRQTGASSVVAGNWLYIDGGEYFDNRTTSWTQLNRTLSIDLSGSWIASSVVINAFNKPSDLPNAQASTLWYNANASSVLSFGGQTYGASSTTTWALHPDGTGAGSWSQVSFNDPNWQSIGRPAYGLDAASSTAGYSLGGTVSNGDGSKNYAVPGLVTFDFASGKWSNLSTIGTYSASGLAVGGSSQFVPLYGKSGVILMIGGSIPSAPGDTDGPLRVLSNITVFDVATQKWYSQTATGDVPQARNVTCVVGAQGSNGSSYEIFMYGGSNSYTDNGDFNAVYILSLPAFHWIRVYGSAPLRAGSSCQVIGNRQMLSVGGLDPTAGRKNQGADPWAFGLGIFDMTALSWGQSYNAKASAYVPPDVVTKYYAKNASYPSWDNPALAAVFKDSITTSTSAGPHPSTATSNQPSTSGGSGATSPVPIGGIVGGVIAGIVIIAVAVGLWLFFRHRKSNKRHTYRPSVLYPPTRKASQRPPQIPEIGGSAMFPQKERPYQPQYITEIAGLTAAEIGTPEKVAKPGERHGYDRRRGYPPAMYHEVEG